MASRNNRRTSPAVTADIYIENFHGSDPETAKYRIAWSVDPRLPGREVDMRTRRSKESAAAGLAGVSVVRGAKACDDEVIRIRAVSDVLNAERRKAQIAAAEAQEKVRRVAISEKTRIAKGTTPRRTPTLEEIAQFAAEMATTEQNAELVEACGFALAGDPESRLKVENAMAQRQTKAKP